MLNEAAEDKRNQKKMLQKCFRRGATQENKVQKKYSID